jgi:hypothetical protein
VGHLVLYTDICQTSINLTWSTYAQGGHSNALSITRLVFVGVQNNSIRNPPSTVKLIYHIVSQSVSIIIAIETVHSSIIFIKTFSP